METLRVVNSLCRGPVRGNCRGALLESRPSKQDAVAQTPLRRRHQLRRKKTKSKK